MGRAAEVRPGTPLTLEQWAELPEDVRGELVHGVLVEEEVADWMHEMVVGWLMAVLRPWVRARGGQIGGSNANVVTGDDRGRHPDLTIFLHGRPPARGVIHDVPDILIEVVSPRPRDQRRDRVEKLAEYAARRVPCYWLVDPQLRTLEVLVLAESGRYEHALSASGGRLTEIPACPELVIDLDELWSEADELERPAAD